MKIGDKVILIEDIEMWNRTYKVGHVFTIYGDSGFRGWDLIDVDGNKIDETAMSSNKYVSYNLKKDRKDKLNNLNKLIR